MSTWKLSIKPDNEPGYDPFNLCKDKSLLGVGWSEAYEEIQASNLIEMKELVMRRYSQWPYPIRKLLEEVKKGDHVWLHQKGDYYLCRAEDEIISGLNIDIDFIKYDLGHARRADWVKVPEVFVSGAIQRGTIARRMIQKINIKPDEKKCNDLIFDQLKNNKDWVPNIDESLLVIKMRQLNMDAIFSIMTPDEVEDMVSAFLQNEGWTLVKSTCFRSKPVFEFSMVNKSSETCYVQVKSGLYPDSLPPERYIKYASKTKKVVLFSTNKNAYPGKIYDTITCLDRKEMFDWLIKNSWSMTESLKIRLWIYLCT